MDRGNVVTAAQMYLYMSERRVAENGPQRGKKQDERYHWTWYAKKFHCSRRTFAYALKVAREAHKDVADAAKYNVVRVSDAARICHCPQDDQLEALKRILMRERRTLITAMQDILQERQFANLHPGLQSMYMQSAIDRGDELWLARRGLMGLEYISPEINLHKLLGLVDFSQYEVGDG